MYVYVYDFVSICSFVCMDASVLSNHPQFNNAKGLRLSVEKKYKIFMTNCLFGIDKDY